MLLFFRKICRIRDGIAANVEQCISKVNDNRLRRSINLDTVENHVRCVQNGLPFETFDPFPIISIHTDVFGHTLAKSVTAKSNYVEAHAWKNKRQRNQYEQDPTERQKRKRRNVCFFL